MARDAKTRQHNRKRAHKELGARRTEASRKRRLDNKAKRDEIHAIDPDIKIIIVDKEPYERIATKLPNGKEEITIGGKITIVDGHTIHVEPIIVKSSLPEGAIKTECDFEDAVIEYQEVMDEEECIKALDFALTSKEGDKYPSNKEPDCKLPAEKKSWKQVLKEWSNS